jgi:hypothetical protein
MHTYRHAQTQTSGIRLACARSCFLVVDFALPAGIARHIVLLSSGLGRRLGRPDSGIDFVLDQAS